MPFHLEPDDATNETLFTGVPAPSGVRAILQ